MEKLKVLLFGYNGENNTGSESRLVTILEDVRQTLGKKFELDIQSVVIEEKNVRRYLPDQDVEMVELGTSWPLGIRWIPRVLKLVFKRNNLMFLVEGSTFTDHFSSFLLYSYLFATLLCRLVKCKVIAYAVDTGNLKPFNQRLTRWVANKMDLIITRSYDAKEKLIEYGVKKEIFVTTDTAFQYKPPSDEYIQNLLSKLKLDKKRPLIGIAPKEFFWWPVTIRPWGKKEDLYRYPYYHTWAPGSKEKSEKVKCEFAKFADYCVEKFDANILFFCMERMDFLPSKDIYEKMKNKLNAKLIPSNDFDLKDISGLLSKLKFLISTRYHACVLSVCSFIPMIAVSHDVRCDSLFKELDIYDFYIPHDSPNLFNLLLEKVNLLSEKENEVKEKIKSAFPSFLDRCYQNRKILMDWFEREMLKENKK